jgi:hypothetical protein
MLPVKNRSREPEHGKGQISKPNFYKIKLHGKWQILGFYFYPKMQDLAFDRNSKQFLETLEFEEKELVERVGQYLVSFLLRLFFIILQDFIQILLSSSSSSSSSSSYLTDFFFIHLSVCFMYNQIMLII